MVGPLWLSLAEADWLKQPKRKDNSETVFNPLKVTNGFFRLKLLLLKGCKRFILSSSECSYCVANGLFWTRISARSSFKTVFLGFLSPCAICGDWYRGWTVGVSGWTKVMVIKGFTLHLTVAVCVVIKDFLTDHLSLLLFANF